MYYSFSATIEGSNVTLNEKNPIEGKYEAIVILKAPLNTNAIPQTELQMPKFSRPISQAENVSNGIGIPPARTDSSPGFVPSIRQGTYAEKVNTPPKSFSIKETPTVTPVEPAGDALSQLYHENTKRDARRSSFSGDVYADVSRDVYQRIMQGEQVSLAFDEGGNYFSSQFVIVENGSLLYLSFYQFNETKPIYPDKLQLLSQVFEIKGKLPGFIKICKPAQVIYKNGAYVILTKGILFLES